MKLTATHDNLRTGLSIISGAVPTRTTVPILSNVRLEAVADGLILSATDLDTTVSHRIPAEVETEGTLTVPAKKLQHFVAELPAAPVRLKAEGTRLELSCGKARMRLVGIPADEYPTLPSFDVTSGYSLSGDTLKEMIDRTSFATSREESRPVLNGVLWERDADQMRMVATDGYRLARYTHGQNGASGGETERLIVPPKALAQVAKVLDAGAKVEVARSENHLGFRVNGNSEIYTRLVEGPYPDYTRIIPPDNDRVLICDREAFTATLRRMAVLANEQTHRVVLHLAGPVVRFSVETPDLGEAHDEIDGSYDGEPMEIAFNANYLSEVLKQFDSAELRLDFKAPERAMTIVPAGDDAPEYLALMMPLRLLA